MAQEIQIKKLVGPFPPNGRGGPHWRQCDTRIEDMSPGAWGPRYLSLTWREDYYRKRNPNVDPMRCVLSANYEIAGMCLCSKHAGQAALALLMGEYVEGITVEVPDIVDITDRRDIIHV